MKILCSLLKGTNAHIVDDIEYYDNYIEGIIVPFDNGECLQIIKNDNKDDYYPLNSYIVINENLNVAYHSWSTMDTANYVKEHINKRK